MLAMAKKKKKSDEGKTLKHGALSSPELARIAASVSGMTPAQVAFVVAQLTSNPEKGIKFAGEPNFNLKDAVKRTEAPIESCLLEVISAETELYHGNKKLRRACEEIGRDPEEAIEWMDRRRAFFVGFSQASIDYMFTPDAVVDIALLDALDKEEAIAAGIEDAGDANEDADATELSDDELD